MAKKRAQVAMVAEDDPQWVRFWEAYPHRVAKKDARKAWADLHPSAAIVDEIVEALDWQTAEWRKKAEWYTPPYPASWLRAERWTDERPATKASLAPWHWQFCEHTPKCGDFKDCNALRAATKAAATKGASRASGV